MFKSDLPAYSIAADVNRRLQESACLVVTAPPGAGKSTVLPLTILEGMGRGPGEGGFFGTSGVSGTSRVSGSSGFSGTSGKILMLEPRRLAARAVAERMAEMLGENVGETVGYRVRFESRVSAATRILVVTEGILTRMLIDDPTLDGVDVVIFDEFHERSIHSDVSLALTREAQQLLRSDLRIVIMSATIDATAICRALASDDGQPASLVESEGRMFPVEVHHAAETATAEDCAERVAAAIREAVVQHKGDVLAFLPGEGEIRRCGEILGNSLGDHTVLAPLYGNLSLAEQRRAIAPSPDGVRKIVLATNIAETSLTIEGVRIVVDSGLCRTMVFDPQSSLSRLQTVRISRDMATQRSGRAGRVAAGVCFRLWTMATEHRMDEQRTAEILTADLAPMVLDIAAWGESRVERLPWLTPPPRVAVAEAQKLLTSLGALREGKITPRGRELTKLPTHPRIGEMLLSDSSASAKALAADVAALLEERDPMASSQAGEQGGAADADLTLRLELLRRSRKRFVRIARAAEQYRRILHVEEDNAAPDPYAVGALLAAAYPERVAKAHADGCGRFVLASGDQVRVEQSDLLAAYDWLAVAAYNANSGRIFLAAPVHPESLTPLLYYKDNISYDFKQGRVVARREERIGGLVVQSKPLNDVPREEILAMLCEAARKRGESMFDFAADGVVALQNRVAAVRTWRAELDFPDLSTAAVLERVEEWLPYYVERPTDDLKRLDLTAALTGLLSYDQQQALDRLAPTHITVPTGSRIRLEYRPAASVNAEGAPVAQPVLRVRLQECFGLLDTPRVDDGRQPVLMELLSPGFKPVQLTQDLRSFWTGTYFDVRKELRRRYPKHHWPDNPLEADPVRGVKRK